MRRVRRYWKLGRIEYPFLFSMATMGTSTDTSCRPVACASCWRSRLAFLRCCAWRSRGWSD